MKNVAGILLNVRITTRGANWLRYSFDTKIQRLSWQDPDGLSHDWSNRALAAVISAVSQHPLQRS